MRIKNQEPNTGKNGIGIVEVGRKFKQNGILRNIIEQENKARMKSIKQKAEEHAPYTENDSWNKIQRCGIAQTSFEAGANYVLDEIEYILEDKDLDCEDICDQLRILIEQLKK